MQEADLAVTAVTINQARYSAVEFLTPYWAETNSFIIKLPDEDFISKCFQVN